MLVLLVILVSCIEPSEPLDLIMTIMLYCGVTAPMVVRWPRAVQ